MNWPTSFYTAVETVVDRKVTDVHAITGGGYSPAQRLRVTLGNKTTVFVKRATEPLTAGWITQESRVYEGFAALGGVDFAPRYFGAGASPDADGTLQPFLVLEDLSDCHWPPPWSPVQVEAVRSALDQLHRTRGDWMAALPGGEEQTRENPWDTIAADPLPFLSVGVCSGQWLEQTLPALHSAAALADASGDDLLHFDVRSDNLCFRPDGRACLIDWNWACRGNAAFDIAGWLPSLQAEGGPPPEALLPGAGNSAAWLAGYFASRAGLPPPRFAPRVRAVQKQQLESALPWACRTLDLPLPC